MLQNREWSKLGSEWREEKGRQMGPLPPAFPSFSLPNSKFIALIASCSFPQCWQIFLELNYKRPYQSSGKENDSRCLMFTSSTKSESRQFHVVVVQWRQIKKAWCTCKVVVLLIWKPIALFQFSLPSPLPLLKLPNVSIRQTEKYVLAVV